MSLNCNEIIKGIALLKQCTVHKLSPGVQGV